MKPCEFENLLGRYHDRELPPTDRNRVEEHLRDCPACAAEVERLDAISLSLRSLTLPKASPEFLARLEALSERVEDLSAFRFVMRLTAAAAAVFIVATTQWALHRNPSVQQTATTSFSSTETAMIDPESAVPSVASNNTVVDPQLDFMIQGLTGGRP